MSMGYPDSDWQETARDEDETDYDDSDHGDESSYDEWEDY